MGDSQSFLSDSRTAIGFGQDASECFSNFNLHVDTLGILCRFLSMLGVGVGWDFSVAVISRVMSMLLGLEYRLLGKAHTQDGTSPQSSSLKGNGDYVSSRLGPYFFSSSPPPPSPVSSSSLPTWFPPPPLPFSASWSLSSIILKDTFPNIIAFLNEI